jgi:hypothetical protein
MTIPQKTSPNETVAETYTRWLSDGETWIGVFENQDLGHRDMGRRIAIPYDRAQWEKAAIGKDRAPDHGSIGLGWRYVLIAKCKTVEEAETAMADRKERER